MEVTEVVEEDTLDRVSWQGEAWGDRGCGGGYTREGVMVRRDMG